MARRNRVPVYSRNAQSLAEIPLRYTSDAEALRLLDEKKAKRVSRPGAPLKIQMLTLERPGKSPCAITAREMEVNAWPNQIPGASAIVAKIEAWTSVGMPRYRAYSV